MDKVPNTSDPSSIDVQIGTFIYSMESFLVYTLNKVSRDKNSSFINTLGPYAVLISRIIERAQKNRHDKIIGPFTVYRGIGLRQEIIQKWKI